MNNYSIVEFIEENTVEIIPSSWLLPDNKTALWPKDINPSTLKRYLKNRIESAADWSSVKIRVLGHAGIFSFYLFLLSNRETVIT